MPIDQIAEQTRTRQNFVTLMMCLLREICAFEVGECRLIQGGIKAEVSLDAKRGHFKLNKVRRRWKNGRSKARLSEGTLEHVVEQGRHSANSCEKS